MKNSNDPSTSVEQRLFEAYTSNKGLRLTADDVDSLVHDDAIGTRITNQAAIEAGVDEPGIDLVRFVRCGVTWKQFLNERHVLENGFNE